MSRVQQKYRVLRLAIEAGEGGFTRWAAAFQVGCYELSARIGELEKEGVVFERQRHTEKNRYGDKVQVTTYILTRCPPEVRAKTFAAGKSE